MKTTNIKTPLDAYIKFLYSVSEKDLKTARKIRNDIKLNRWMHDGTHEGDRWGAFDEITGRNRRYREMKRTLAEMQERAT